MLLGGSGPSPTAGQRTAGLTAQWQKKQTHLHRSSGAIESFTGLALPYHPIAATYNMPLFLLPMSLAITGKKGRHKMIACMLAGLFYEASGLRPRGI